MMVFLPCIYETFTECTTSHQQHGKFSVRSKLECAPDTDYVDTTHKFVKIGLLTAKIGGTIIR